MLFQIVYQQTIGIKDILDNTLFILIKTGHVQFMGIEQHTHAHQNACAVHECLGSSGWHSRRSCTAFTRTQTVTILFINFSRSYVRSSTKRTRTRKYEPHYDQTSTTASNRISKMFGVRERGKEGVKESRSSEIIRFSVIFNVSFKY